MSEIGIGSRLKKEREAKGLRYDKISEDLKIQVKFLEAFDKEDFSNFPGEVYVKAFLKAYAGYLGLNTDEIIDMYNKSKSSKQGQPAPRYAELEDLGNVKRESKKKFKYVVSDNVKLGILAVLGIIFIIIIGLSVKSCINNRPEKTEPSVSDDYNNMPALMLAAEATDEVWIKVTIDKEGPKEKMLKKEMKMEWEAKEEIHIDIGDKNVIKLTLNGKPVDLSKYKSEVVRDLVFKKEDIKNGK